VHYTIGGMAVNILWEATADVPTLVLASGQSTFDFTKMQIPNNAGAGKNGDILFSTIGASTGDTYTIILEMVKSYAD
jgi:hypothetical protein